MLTIILIAMNLAALAWTLKSSPAEAAAWAQATGTPMVGLSDARYGPLILTLAYLEGLDGSVVRVELDDETGAVLGMFVIRPATRWGHLKAWGPVYASRVVTLLVVGLGSLGARRWLIQRIRGAQISMIQGMALIGAVAILLWLLRVNRGLILAGSIVLALLGHAARRRGFLAKEIRSEGTNASILSRAGLVGYSIAAVLALAWVFCIFLWDVFEQSYR